MHNENVIFCNLGLLRWKWLIITIFSYACNSFNNNFPCSFSYTFELGVGNTCVEHFYINGLFSIGQSLNPNLILGWRRFYCSKNWEILHREKSFYNMNTENILKNILFHAMIFKRWQTPCSIIICNLLFWFPHPTWTIDPPPEQFEAMFVSYVRHPIQMLC